MGCQNRACPAQLPTACTAFYCCHIIASVFWPAGVQSAKLKPSDPQCKWNEMNMEAWYQRQTSAIQYERERARQNRIKASADCGLPGIDSHWRISQDLWIMFTLKRSCSCLTVKKELCVSVRERLWLLNVPSFSYNKKKTERFFFKMEISNAYFMVENIWIFSQTKCDSHSEL